MSIPARFKEYERFTLEGPNLGSRQRELNMRVLDAASEVSGLNMNIADETLTDVDILFRIELAFKYRCIDFLMEVMKTGDSLYISRALKCDWMYDEEFSHIINVEYLKFNVFPSMSMKMRKKFLTTAAMYVTEPKRALQFYKYCMEVKLINIALKFLISTSEDFKLQVLNSTPDQIYYVTYKDEDLKYFIANSFTVADSYLKLQKNELGKAKVLCLLSYLYKISNSEYLELMEKNCKPYSDDMSLLGKYSKLGRRISKNIISNYKQRVLQTPRLYVIMLSKISMVNQSTVDDVKTCLNALLYEDVNDFWKSSFCDSYDYLINKIPEKERFQYIKDIFSTKYPGEEFEMDKKFYDLQWYRFMTEEEIEHWALAHIANKTEILGAGKDYNWYKFVNFEKAFEEVKKLVDSSNETDRAQIVYALINCAKTQRHLEKLFNYYCVTFSKEKTHVKGNFIDRVASYHNVYEFDEQCWEAFYKVLQTLDLHNLPEMNKNHFVTILIVYNIINDIELDENLTLFVHTGIYFFTVKMQTDQLSPERTEKVFQYLLNAYMNKIYELDSKPYGEDVKYQIRKYVYYVLDLCKLYEKPAIDIPEVIINLMNKDLQEFQGMRVYEYDLKKPKKVLNELDLLRFLKRDIALSKEYLPLVKKRIEMDYRFNIGMFLKKIKVYFPNDLSLEYIKLYRDLLSADVLYPKVALAASYGIFHLADYKDRVSFVAAHAPLKSRDFYFQEDLKVLHIQDAICATAYYSRPPLPLDIVLMYVKGDYVARCLPMLNSYLVNLPIDDCIEFVARILNNTLLVQKYGVRLAFGCFNLDNLQKLIWSIWKKTKDVSLRMVLYKALYAKIVKDDLHAPTALFETLCKLTLDMNINDDKEAFSIMTLGTLPRHLAGEYTIVAWKAVSALPDISIGIERKALFVRYLYRFVNFLNEDTIRTIIDEIITSEFHSEKPLKRSPEDKDLDKAKWEFIAKYVLSMTDKEHLEMKWEMTESMLDRSLSNFNLIHKDVYITRMLCFKFIRTLMSESYFIESISIDYGNMLFDKILDKLKSSFKIEDVYILTWEIRVDLLVRKAIGEVLIKLHILTDEDEQSVAFRNILINFGKDVANVILEYIESNLYFRCFLPELYNLMNDKMNNLANFANRDVGSDDVAVMLCWALLEYKMADLNLFAAGILPPDNCRSFTEDYKLVLKQLKELNDIEINCKLCEKFVNSDFKVKPLAIDLIG